MREQQLAAVDDNDVLLVLTFDDYTPETIEIASAAHKKGRTLLVITDNELSPVAKLGTAHAVRQGSPARALPLAGAGDGAVPVDHHQPGQADRPEVSDRQALPPQDQPIAQHPLPFSPQGRRCPKGG